LIINHRVSLSFRLIFVIIILVIEHLLRALIHQFIENHGRESASKGYRGVQVDRVPARKALIEQTGHLNAHSSGWVHDCSVGRDGARIAKECRAGSHVGTGQNEADDGHLVGELSIRVGQEEENVQETAEELLG